jgi:PhnB protein
MSLNTYVHFNGNCEEAFKFYEKVLGGKIQAIFTFEGSPMASQVPAEWGKKVMHASMAVDGSVLMGSDAPPGRYSKAAGFSVSINVKNAADAERIYNAMLEGAEVHMPMAETFWALRFGMLTDKFGVPWMINAEKPM